jgi:uncharacterized protein
MDESLLPIAILFAALLYSSVGHGGGSGYLAVMSLAGITQIYLKSSSLTLNIFVASLAVIQFGRTKAIAFPLLLPLVITSIPAAMLASSLKLPNEIYGPLLGSVLLFSGVRLILGSRTGDDREVKRPAIWISLLVGGLIGLISGLTGTGGGIFLSPLLVFMGWSTTKESAGTSAGFILLNSIGGLLGLIRSNQYQLPEHFAWWVATAIIGGAIGSYLGSRKLSSNGLRRMLGIVLLIAAAKLFKGVV